MQDKFKDFIDEHRAEFDLYEPPDRVWNTIGKRLPGPKKRNYLPWYQAAAVLLFIAGGAAVLLLRNMQATAPEQQVITRLQPEVNEAEHYYNTVVETSLTELDAYSTEYPDLCRNFKTEIDTLNRMYVQLKNEYSKSGGNEAVLQAMVDNLQKQVSLIKLQIDIIQSVKQKKQSPQNKKTRFT